MKLYTEPSNFQFKRPDYCAKFKNFTVELCEYLSEEYFYEVPIGRIMVGSAMSMLSLNNLNVKKAAAKNFLKLIYFIFFRKIHQCFTRSYQVKNKKTSTAKIGINIWADTERSNSFWEPIAKMLGPENVVLVVTSDSDIINLGNEKDKIDTFYVRNVSSDWPKRLLWLMLRLPRLWIKIGKILKSYGYPSGSEMLVLKEIFRATEYIAKAKNTLKVGNLRCYLSFWDQWINAPLTIMLKNKGIPTYTHVHGAFGKYSAGPYLNLNSEYVFVWGEYQKQLFKDAGTPESRIIVSGYPRRLNSASYNQENIYAKIDSKWSSGSIPLILIAFSSFYTPSQCELWIEMINKLKELMPDFRFLCRIHPSDKREKFSNLKEDERLKIVEQRDLSLDECIEIADVVIVHSSTVSMDVILQDKILAVLDPFFYIYEISHDIVEFGAAIYATTADEMAMQIKKIFSVEEYRNRILDRAKQFKNHYISQIGLPVFETIVQHLKKA